MKKLGLIMIIIFFIGIMLTSGCVKDGDEEEEKTVSATQGIETVFLTGAPPTEIGEADDFDISVQLSNKGEHEISEKKLWVHILGINPASFKNFGVEEDPKVPTSQDNTADLTPTQIVNDEEIPGGIDILTWSGVTNIVDIDADQELKIVAQTCYTYHTKAKATACFNVNPYMQATGAETCKVQGEKDVTNTGAPVKITKVTEYPAGKEKFRFMIEVENKGGGVVYSPEIAAEDCTDKSIMQTKNLNKVSISAVYVGTTNFTDKCSPKEVRLAKGKGQFTCSVDLTDQFAVSEYEDFLRIDLEYGYYEQSMGKLTLKAIPGVDASA